jgi:hypothetical protein
MELMTKMRTISLLLMMHETKRWMVGQHMYLNKPCVRSTAKHSWHWLSPQKRMSKKRNISVTAFKAVFGQKLDHPLSCSKSEACPCWAVKDCMLGVSNKPDFDSYCKENYIIDDDDVYNANEVIDEDGVNEDNDGYFSEDEVPLDEMDEVDDAYFNEHIMDNTATNTPNKSSGKKKGKKEEVEPPSSVMDAKKITPLARIRGRSLSRRWWRQPLK